ncbi:coiled-coil-helix-coiled-coil-helix domain-containing protein 7-like [Argiope bruennichi]|uniref:coiled-coil-helix-coiled-coil-helix domain-containing protein 7-like n=1 Tax=Argiope bruennichi TaxID=94029 RepID=UPI002495237F|nr:coiled-coil-helix-coiled-coil-helix domain-containing protein 7-like [Argiope bruennichi]
MSDFHQISDGERHEEAKRQFKERTERINPCYKERDASLKCLDEFYYARAKCQPYFDNYKNCRAFWGFVVRERRKAGIKPHIPAPEERDQVKAEYLPRFKP